VCYFPYVGSVCRVRVLFLCVLVSCCCSCVGSVYCFLCVGSISFTSTSLRFNVDRASHIEFVCCFSCVVLYVALHVLVSCGAVRVLVRCVAFGVVYFVCWLCVLFFVCRIRGLFVAHMLYLCVGSVF